MEKEDRSSCRDQQRLSIETGLGDGGGGGSGVE